MSKEMDELRKLAGITKLHDRSNWRLNEAAPTFELDDEVVASDTAGVDSGKRGTVVSIDGGWAQIKTEKNEKLWLPNSKLAVAK